MRSTPPSRIRSSHGFAAIALFALPFAALTPTASGAIGEETLATFSDGSAAVAFSFTWYCEDIGLNISLPFDARVYGAVIKFVDNGQASGAEGTVGIDIGYGSSVDLENFSRVYDAQAGTAWLPLKINAVTAYVADQASSGSVTVPIRVTPCINVVPWNVTISIEVTYKYGAPVFSIPIPDYQIVLGSANPRWSGAPEMNLTEHFPGTFNPIGRPPLPYLMHWSVERDDGGSPSASAVLIDNARPGPFGDQVEPRNDTMEFFEVTSSGTWTGSLVFRVKVTDYWNRSAISNDITLCVVAKAGDACAGPGGPQEQAPAAPTEISTGGQRASVVEAGVATSFDVSLSAPLGPNATVEWFVDGAHAGSGLHLENVMLAEGNHDLEARVVDAGGVQSLHAAVYARPPGPLGAVPLLGGFSEWQRVTILLTLSAVGVFFVRSGGGRFYVASLLIGAIMPRTRKEALLDHFVRGRLYQVIVENPGIHFSELRRRTGAGNGSTLYHLGILEKAGFINVVVESSKTRFYPTDQSFDRSSYGLTSLDRRVVEAIEQSPGIQQKEIARALGESASSVSRTVRRLVGFGLVTSSRRGRDVALFPRESPGEAPR